MSDEPEIKWPKPRQDPVDEPAEPWAKPDAPEWRELLEKVFDAPHPEKDPEP